MYCGGQACRRHLVLPAQARALHLSRFSASLPHFLDGPERSELFARYDFNDEVASVALSPQATRGHPTARKRPSRSLGQAQRRVRRYIVGYGGDGAGHQAARSSADSPWPMSLRTALLRLLTPLRMAQSSTASS